MSKLKRRNNVEKPRITSIHTVLLYPVVKSNQCLQMVGIIVSAF